MVCPCDSPSCGCTECTTLALAELQPTCLEVIEAYCKFDFDAANATTPAGETDAGCSAFDSRNFVVWNVNYWQAFDSFDPLRFNPVRILAPANAVNLDTVMAAAELYDAEIAASVDLAVRCWSEQALLVCNVLLFEIK